MPSTTQLELPESPADSIDPQSFASVDQILQAADKLFRQTMQERGQDPAAYREAFHASLDLTSPTIPLNSQFLAHHLTQVEREVVLALLMLQLGFFSKVGETCSDVVDLLGFAGAEKLAALRALHPQGRLARLGMVHYEDEEEDLRKLEPLIDPDLIEAALLAGTSAPDAETIATEEEFNGSWVSDFVRMYSRRIETISSMEFRAVGSRLQKLTRKLNRQLRTLETSLALHHSWGFSKLLALQKVPAISVEGQILLVLLGKELGHVPPYDELFRGGCLAKAVSRGPGEERHALACFRSQSPLVLSGLIQPAAGEDELLSDRQDQLARTEFELGDKALEILSLPRSTKAGTYANSQLRAARLSLGQVILAPSVRRAVDMAIAHATRGARLVDDWGLGETIPYGRAVTLLFYGPPGVGKTALAEGIAHELNRPMLAVDYSRLHSCFVGASEKNIVRAFREATRHKAVLFFDEADAMFADRGGLTHNWEMRQADVLLQEVERFDGVCILSTNREMSLDPALERRITMKVPFERPDGTMRRRIWQKLLPERLPLGQDVNLDMLGKADLSGGEIKNVILNAARMALQRCPDGPVTMEDFEEAIQMEESGRLSQEHHSRIGFSTEA